MTKKELVKIIQEAVRREVKKEVKKIFIKEETSSQLKDITPVISKPKNTKEVQYTKDEVLNKVLNETKSGLSSQDNEEYPTLGGSAFDSTRMSELMGYGKPEEVKRDMVAVDTMKKAGVSVDQVPESLVNALTRDYSDLMKHDKMKSKR
jgi:hypothetical protein|tara:strand:+ start:1949 stop:2395 length:447 start_codon:yes stop_codon:yes gene_type:complete